MESNGRVAMLRHAVATLAYRGGKAIRGAPEGFADFQAGGAARTPGQILAHLGDLLDWALRMCDGKRDWLPAAPRAWDADAERFFAALEAFDRRLASGEPLAAPEEKLFQGPIADALAHVGQILLLRRLAGAAARSENYFMAGIAAGRVGTDQAAPKFEFD